MTADQFRDCLLLAEVLLGQSKKCHRLENVRVIFEGNSNPFDAVSMGLKFHLTIPR